MPQFRKGVAEVEAMQFLGFEENGRDLERFLGGAFETHLPAANKVVVRTLEGELTAGAGDWLIRGVAGDIHLCKPDIFAATYEPA